MNKPLVSVIIPTFNRPKQVREAVLSVLGQYLAFNVQILVIDDASPPSYELHDLERLGTTERSIQVLHTGHVGLEGARNLGLLYSEGTYVQFLDDDDIIYPDKLRMQIDFAIRSSPGSVIVSPWCLRGPDGALVHEDFIAPNGDQRERFMRENFAPIHAYLFPRKILAKIGGFDSTSCDMEDWDLLVRIALNGANFASTGDPCCEYRFHNSNMMRNAGSVFKGACGWLNRIHKQAGITGTLQSREAICTLALMAYSHVRREQGKEAASPFLCHAASLLSMKELVKLLGDAVLASVQPAGSIFLPEESVLQNQATAVEYAVEEMMEELARKKVFDIRVSAQLARSIRSYLYWKGE